MVAPCWTSWEAYFFFFWGLHTQGHTSRSVLACVIMPQTLSWQNAAQTARFWPNVLSGCTPQNMFPLTSFQNLNAPIFLRPYGSLPSKKFQDNGCDMHVFLSGLPDPPDGSGFCPFVTWHLENHTPKWSKLSCIITLRRALCNALFFFLVLRNGHCLQRRGSNVLMIYSQLAPPNQTVKRNMCCYHFFGKIFLVYKGDGVGFNWSFTQQVKKEEQAKKLQDSMRKCQNPKHAITSPKAAIFDRKQAMKTPKQLAACVCVILGVS